MTPSLLQQFNSSVHEKFNHYGLRRYSKNLGWMFIARFITMAISFIAIAYIARNLGPSNYGELSYAISYVSLFAFIASLGIEQVLYRDILASPEKRSVIMGTALVLRMGAGIGAAILGVAIALLISPEALSPILITILSTSFFFSSFHLLGQEFQADVRAKLPSLLSIIVTLLLNALKIFVIASGQGVIYLALVLALEPILYMFGYIMLRTRYYGSLFQFSFDKSLAVRILRDALPLTFVAAFSMIYARIDQVFIKHFIDAASVGLYDAAVRLSEIWYFIPNILVAGLFPALMNARQQSPELFLVRTRKLFFLVTTVSLVTALFTSLLANTVVSIVFGETFIQSATVLQIYIWSNIGIGLNLVIHQILIAERLGFYIALSASLGMIVNIALLVILIPAWGMYGAAIGSVVAYIVPFCSLFFFRKTRRTMRSIFSI